MNCCSIYFRAGRISMFHNLLFVFVVLIAVVLLITLLALATETWKADRGWAWLALVAAGVIALALVLSVHFANARDAGQWENSDPATRDWYQSLMQPDVPNASCCGEADAYFCDEIHVRQEKTFCAITDDRDDAPRSRPHRSLGTEFEIPNNKLKWDAGNPTGHAVIFLSRNDFVFCFVQGIGG